jgi:predicted component of type VI protein secretion system
VSARRALFVAGATAAGVAAGWLLAQGYLHHHKTALFSQTPRQRHAALGYLAGRPSPDTLRLLRDYLAWERHPGLKRRGIRVMRRLEAALA